MRRLVPLLLALGLAGCGSLAAAELPAPAGPPPSPPLTADPFGRVEAGSAPAAEKRFTIDRERDRLSDGERSVATCREPIDVEELDRGARVAVLCGRARVVEVYDAETLERKGSAPAGIGPTSLATDNVEVLYVIDALGEALLVYHLRPFELIRRVHLGGGPYAIAFDRGRWGLWITLNATNQVTYYAAGTRPVIRDTLPSIRDARDVSVDGDAITVSSQDERQVLRRAK